jgi:hypothetical protein
MSQLAAVAISLVGALCVLDLLLTLAVIRRLREVGTRLSALERSSPSRGPSLLPVGASVPEFSAVTAAGEPLSERALAGGRSLVAFLHGGCAPCRDLVPELKAYAAGPAGGGRHVLAVVVGEEDGPANGLAGELREVATVVRGADAPPVASAFAVTGFPTLYAVADGRVQAAGPDALQLLRAG